MLGALIHCWVHLAGVSGREKTYPGSSITIKIYPTLSLAIGGRDGVDGVGGHWMTCSIIRTRHQTWLSGRFLTVGCIWWGFRVRENVFKIYYTTNSLLYYLISYWGAGWGGWQRRALDDAVRHFPFWEVSPEMMLRVINDCWIHLGGGFGWGKNVFRVYHNNKILSCPSLGHWGAGWRGSQQWMMCFIIRTCHPFEALGFALAVGVIKHSNLFSLQISK